MSSKILVTSISPLIEKRHLVELFECCGTIVHADLQTKGDDKVCSIEFKESSHAKAASFLSGTPLGSKSLVVTLVAPTPTPAAIATPTPTSPSMMPQQNQQMNMQAMMQMNAMRMGQMNPMMMNPMMQQQRMMMMMQMQMQANAMNQQNAAGAASPAGAAAGVANFALNRSPTMNAALQTRADDVSRTIYVGNLAPMIQETHLRQFFSACGDINHVKCVGTAQRHGFIEFAKKESVMTAISLNGSQLGDRVIKVSTANSPIVKDTTDATKKVQDAMEKVRLAQEAIKNKKISSSSSRSRSRSRGKDKKKRRKRRSRSRSRGRRRSRRYSSSRSCSRSRSRGRGRRRRSRSRTPPRKKKKSQQQEGKEGMFWDGFQWIAQPIPLAILVAEGEKAEKKKSKKKKKSSKKSDSSSDTDSSSDCD